MSFIDLAIPEPTYKIVCRRLNAKADVATNVKHDAVIGHEHIHQSPAQILLTVASCVSQRRVLLLVF